MDYNSKPATRSRSRTQTTQTIQPTQPTQTTQTTKSAPSKKLAPPKPKVSRFKVVVPPPKSTPAMSKTTQEPREASHKRKRSSSEEEDSDSEDEQPVKKQKVGQSTEELVEGVRLILPSFSKTRVRSALEAHNMDPERTVDFLLNQPLLDNPPTSSPFVYTIDEESYSDNEDEITTITLLRQQNEELIQKLTKYKERIRVLTGGFGWKAHQKMQKIEQENSNKNDECRLCYEVFSSQRTRYKLACGCCLCCLPCYKEYVLKVKRTDCPFCQKKLR
eukprot:TRINITY_DN9109_c0_g1_i1.p1 TRINITY_DN9109_c0_g1~~TRINITY_DN9109_c0_g1_i1.p1  ORF type:complete len:275 (-),score=44.47 TRINITY_DN9109_c0_g1_i1:73-897(-)